MRLLLLPEHNVGGSSFGTAVSSSKAERDCLQELFKAGNTV